MQRLEGQGLREFLHPFQAAFSPTDANAQTIFHAGRGLSHPKTSSGTVFKSKQGSRKVMYEAPGHDVSYLRSDFIQFQSCNKSGEVMRVCSDIAHHQGRSAAGWVI